MMLRLFWNECLWLHVFGNIRHLTVYICIYVCVCMSSRVFPIFTPIMWFTETLKDKMFCSQRMLKSNWVWHIDTCTAVSSTYLPAKPLNNHTVIHTYINHTATGAPHQETAIVFVFSCEIALLFSFMSQLTLECQHSWIRRSVEGTPSLALPIGWLQRSSPVTRTPRPRMTTGYLLT